jgi:hypothetical protein
MNTGIELIAQERKEQIEKHGRTVELDVKNNEDGQLPEAAQHLMDESICQCNNCKPADWDATIWKKMTGKPYKERLIIAGALIAAEIDRLTCLE